MNVLNTARRVAALCWILLLGKGLAQITITPADIPSHVGDTFQYKRNDVVATVNVGQSGGPHTWTFDTASFTGPVKYQAVVDKNTTPFAGLFPTANVTYATQGDTSLVNAYTFFQLGSTELDGQGVGLQFTDTLQSRVYQPVELAAPMPMTYGQTWQSSYGWTDSFPPIVMTTDVREWNRVDAWGQVTTPAGTFSCLRVNMFDTIISTAWASGVPIYADSLWRRCYMWYVPQLGIAASARSLNRDTSSNFTSSDCYRVMIRVRSGIEELSPLSAPPCLPLAVVARRTLLLPRSLVQDPGSELALLDLSGCTVMRISHAQSVAHGTVDVSGLSRGVYFLRQTLAGRQTLAQKIVLVD
jgi:hypothetical protein